MAEKRASKAQTEVQPKSTSEVDFSALSFGDAPDEAMPKKTAGTGRKPEDNPFTLPLQDSYEAGGKVKTVPIPDTEDARKKAENKVRGAASAMSKGVQVRFSEPQNGRVTMYFKCVDKRPYTDRKAKSE